MHLNCFYILKWLILLFSDGQILNLIIVEEKNCLWNGSDLKPKLHKEGKKVLFT